MLEGGGGEMSSYSAWLVFLLLFALTKDTSQTRAGGGGGAGAAAAEFRRHRVVRPVVHARERRHISTTRRENGLHEDRVEVSVEAGDARYLLELRLNRHLLPHNHTLAYESGGRVVRHRPTPEEAELCQYQGRIRDVEGSWAAVSTCRGLRGVIYDGHHLHYIEPAGGELTAPHRMYRHSELVGERECGYRGGVTNNTHFDPHLHRLYRQHRDDHRTSTRRKRSVGDAGSALYGPFNANKMSRYVELALVVDHAGYRDSGQNLRAIHAECKDIANIINAMYAPLNIFIALVYVEVWVEGDKILLVDKGDDTLTNFLQYRRTGLLLQHPNDNAQLLTRHRFENGVVGKALKGTMCTYEYSGGINTNHSDVVGLVATTIAHEMGHNFGMEHDSEEDCRCPDKKCIMSPSSNSVSPVHWSSCSQEALALAFEHGLDYCLRNKPRELFESPTCGNGFVEAGEECDCGPGAGAGACAACCHADTCALRRNATCATGPCCDLTRCGVRAAGSVCREATQECDLPEYCTGHSEFCPADVYKMNTLPCDNRQAYCYEGSCRSHTDQCRLLWGSSGTQSHEKCYGMNKNGSRHGNCGYDRPRKHYEKCAPEDVLCGMLHCRHLNEQLEFGVESVSTLSHTFININGTIIPCRTALVDLGLNQVDPGLVPNGAKCGHNKMCENQKCVSVEAVRARLLDAPASVCPSDCSGHGFCNSKGRCHCERGFAPPLCELPGPGGSADSGPASNPNVQRNFMVAMYVMFLGVIPSVLLLLLLSYYSRHNLLLWWKRPRKPSPSPKKGSLQRRLSRGASKLAANFQPSHPPHAAAPPRPAADDMSSSLLRSDSDCSPPAAHLNPANFFGHFKGFSLAPLDKAPPSDLPAVSVIGGFAHDDTFETSDRSAKIVPIHKNGGQTLANGKVPARSAPPVPVVPASAAAPADRPSSPKLGLRRNNSSVQSRIKALMGDKSDATPAYMNNVPAPRPTISSPILEASTCTAKELISPLQGSKTLGPVRPAPGVPPLTDLPKRPLSMETNVFLKPLPEEPVQKKVKEGISLNRIASFLKQDKSRNPVERSHSLPKNQNQLKAVDKTVLRNLQISNPILQKEIELPVNTVPVVSDSEDADDSKQFVNRAQSMRGPSLTQRPNIPNFGSMRQPSGAARPLSIVLGSRPTSPPPPRPSQPDPSIPGLPGYQNPAVKSVGTDVKSPEYVDCVGEKQAPLADINEESPGDNIYAVIEENPLARAGAARAPAAPVRTVAQAPPAGYNTPKPIGSSNSGSSESVGLLGEIVSEIQTRNLDSIYSTSTLARRKRERDERERKLRGRTAPTAADDDDDENDNTTYANTESEYDHAPAPSTTSSGYLHPSAVNVPRFLNNNPAAAPHADRPSSPLAPRGPNSKIPTLGRQLTPPGLRAQVSLRNAPSSPKSAHKLKSNSPDVVSSCAVGGDKAGKSPDVVNSNANKPPAGDALKPAPRAPVPPKPAEKPSVKSALSVDKKNMAMKSNPLTKTVSAPVEQKIGSVQKIQTERTNPKVVAKLDQTKSAEVNKSKPKPVPKPASVSAGRERPAAAAAGRLASRPSNVASLQQKFENRKSVGKDALAAARK